MPKYAELDAFREQNFITEADGEMLHREARALALKRIEESARTVSDFEEVLVWWDRLDANRERRERAHEVGRTENLIEWRSSGRRLPAGISYDTVLQKQLLAGDFIDYIFDRPEDIRELVSDGELSVILDGLKLPRKQLLYYLVVLRYPVTAYAAIRGQTDRNIRGIRETTMKKLRKDYRDVLESRVQAGSPLTMDERYFLGQADSKKSGH